MPTFAIHWKPQVCEELCLVTCGQCLMHVGGRGCGVVWAGLGRLRGTDMRHTATDHVELLKPMLQSVGLLLLLLLLLRRLRWVVRVREGGAAHHAGRQVARRLRGRVGLLRQRRGGRSRALHHPITVGQACRLKTPKTACRNPYTRKPGSRALDQVATVSWDLEEPTPAGSQGARISRTCMPAGNAHQTNSPLSALKTDRSTSWSLLLFLAKWSWG